MPNGPIVELSYRDIMTGRMPVFDTLRNGSVLIVRGIAPILAGRAEMIQRAGTASTAGELAAFYEAGQTPSLETIAALGGAIKTFRSHRRWSVHLHDFFTAMNLPGPVLYDGGIPRLVLPAAVVAQARASGVFDPADFKRLDPASATEIFMPAPANIHRDYNRQHHLFQINIWWPLHDASAREVLRIYPHLYHAPVYDRNGDADGLAALGPHLEYRLAFGDAILFHGEQLHTSPVGVPGGRRQSVDFRVACCCTDDNAHYRSGYLNAHNFVSAAAIERIVRMETEAENLAAPWFDAAFAAFNELPFAEDRYLLLHQTAKAVNPAVAAAALEEVVARSGYYFWVMKAGELGAAAGLAGIAKQAAARVLVLTSALPPPPDFMPVAYANPPNHVTPEAATAWAEGIVR